MQTLLERIASRHLTSAAEYRPPKWLVAAVDKGDLDVRCLKVWEYVVKGLTEHGPHFDYGAATKYWRNKCLKIGLVVPEEFIEGGGGEGAIGKWSVKNGDQIEEWVRETLKSSGLIDGAKGREVEIRLDMGHFERLLEEQQAKLDDHIAKLEGATGKSAVQRKAWADKARAKCSEYSDELGKLEDALKAVTDTLSRYDSHKAPAVEFEQDFQALVTKMVKTMDRKDILDAIRKAAGDADRALEVAEAAIANEPEGLSKEAGLWDKAVGLLTRAWTFFTHAWESLKDWVKGLVKVDEDLNSMLDAAKADK